MHGTTMKIMELKFIHVSVKRRGWQRRFERRPSTPLSYSILRSRCYSAYWHEYKVNILGGCIMSGGGNVKPTETDRNFTN